MKAQSRFSVPKEAHRRLRKRRTAAASIATLALAALSMTTALAAEPGWTVLGRTQASHKKDHDVVVVRGPADNYHALKFKVKDAPLNLHAVEVTYDNNTRERLDVRQNIPRGGESRPINLRGGKRSLRRVEFWYDTKGMGQGRADVTVLGRH